MKLITPQKSLSDVFWSKVDQAAGQNQCWPWTGSTNGAGYGTYQVDGVRLYAHRQAYAEAKGTVPAGLIVRHDCDNPICCNPSHLQIGTMADNSQDAVKRGRFAGRRVVSGEQHPQAKLQASDITDMRARFDADRRGDTQRAAEAFSISHSQASRILRRQAWPNL